MRKHIKKNKDVVSTQRHRISYHIIIYTKSFEQNSYTNDLHGKRHFAQYHN